MGRGDKRTKKGKIKAASYGNCRSHKPPVLKIVPKLEFKTSAPDTTEKAAEVKTKDAADVNVQADATEVKAKKSKKAVASEEQASSDAEGKIVEKAS